LTMGALSPEALAIAEIESLFAGFGK
jgi:hypothetical protein